MRVLLFLAVYIRARYFSHFRSQGKLQQWQSKKIKSLLKYVLAKSPFYQALIEKTGAVNISQFPIINKQIMMASFDEINTVGLNANVCVEKVVAAEKSREFDSQINKTTLGLSTGTSGQRGLFAVSESEQIRWAANLLAKALPSSIFQPQRIVLFLRSNSKLYESLSVARVQFSYCDPILELREHVDFLNRTQPTVLVAPPSILKELGRLQSVSKLKINPERIFSVAEVLEKYDELTIKKCFSAPLLQIYQATEGFLACSCPVGNLHLNEDLIYFEKKYLSEGDSRFQPIITDLFRKTQPVIRYLLNDVLIEKKGSCPCGSKLEMIERIEGRCDDVFYLPDENGELKPLWPDFIARTFSFLTDKIDDFSVTQVDSNNLEVAFTSTLPDRSSTEIKITAELSALFKKFKLKQPQIIFVAYENPKPLQKLRRIRRQSQTNEIPT